MYTNTRQQATVVLQKHWNNGATGDQAELSITGGVTDPATATSTVTAATGSTFTDTTNQATTDVHTGDQVTVAEDLPGANTGSYDTTLACDNGVTPNADGTFHRDRRHGRHHSHLHGHQQPDRRNTDPAQDLGERCGRGHRGPDDHRRGQAANDNTSTVPSPAPLLFDGSHRPPGPDAQIQLRAGPSPWPRPLGAGNTGLATTPSWSATTARSRHHLRPPSPSAPTPAPITCTVTNTRQTATVVLQKHWNNAATGDTANLSIAGGTPDPATATSTATSPTFTDTANQAAAAVRTGDQVTVTEDLPAANTGSYQHHPDL